MPPTKLDTARRIDPYPCSEEKRKQEFAKMQRYLEKLEDGLIPGIGGAASNMPIGTVLMWALGPGAIPAGWAVMDGTANAAGSGIDMRGKFAKGIATTPSGTPGGSTTYAVTGSITGGGSTSTSSETDTYSGTTDTRTFTDKTTDSQSPSYSGTTATSNLSGFTGSTIVADHASHYHNAFSTASVMAGSDHTVITAINTDVYDTINNRIHATHDHSLSGVGSHSHTYSGSVASHSHTITGSTLNHDHDYSGTTDGHTHTIDTSGLGFTGNDITGVEPPFIELIFIERIA